MRAIAAARTGEMPKTVNRVRDITVIERAIIAEVILKGVTAVCSLFSAISDPDMRKKVLPADRTPSDR